MYAVSPEAMKTGIVRGRSKAGSKNNHWLWCLPVAAHSTWKCSPVQPEEFLVISCHSHSIFLNHSIEIWCLPLETEIQVMETMRWGWGAGHNVRLQLYFFSSHQSTRNARPSDFGSKQDSVSQQSPFSEYLCISCY